METEKIIDQKFAELTAKKADIEAKTAPLRKEYNDLQPQIDAVLNKQKELGKQIKAIEAENGLHELCGEISRVALLKKSTKRLGG